MIYQQGQGKKELEAFYNYWLSNEWQQVGRPAPDEYITEAAEGKIFITRGGNKHELVAQGWNHLKLYFSFLLRFIKTPISLKKHFFVQRKIIYILSNKPVYCLINFSVYITSSPSNFIK